MRVTSVLYGILV